MRVLLVYPNAKKEIIGWGDLGVHGGGVPTH